MINLGIVGIVNFNEWDNPNYKETGGINSVVKTIVPHLRADKIVLYGITDKRENLFTEKMVGSNICIFPIICVAAGSIVPRRVMSFLFGWRIYKYTKAHRINFIYNHAEEFGFWLTFKKIPYIHHLHTYVNVLEVSDSKLAKFKLFHTLWEKMRFRVIKHSHKIVAVNKDIVAKCQAIIGKNRIIEFPNYIDFSMFVAQNTASLEKRYRLENEKVALFIGRISKIKGLELFVDTVKELNDTSGDKWIGILVGNGEYEPALRKHIQIRGMDDKFIFAGSINNQQELCQYYSLANIFLITSFSESVPLTLLESLCCGTPVVSTNVGISSEVLSRGNGYTIETRDPGEFAKKIVLSIPFKSTKSLLLNDFRYSVEFASDLLNKELTEDVTFRE